MSHEVQTSLEPQSTGDTAGSSFVVVWLLSWFFGWLGVDRFVLGKVGTAIAKLLTLGGLGVWWLIDLVVILTGTMLDRHGRPLRGYLQHRRMAWIVSGVLVIVGMTLGAVTVTQLGPLADRGATPQISAAPKTTDPLVVESDVTVGESPDVERAKVAIPEDLVGRSADEAAAILSDLGLVPTFDGEGDATVVSVEPRSGEVVEGSVVILVVEQMPELTLAQRNAVSSAEDYLDFAGFSRSGLLDQLEYEGYAAADAEFAVDYVAPDWNAEAAEKAENYLAYSAFSMEGLADQLAYEGFTAEQVEFALAAVGY